MPGPTWSRWMAAMAAGFAVACGSPARGTRISMWVHAGPGPERAVYESSIAAFNAAQRAAGKPLRVDLTVLPEGSYNDQIHAAAIARQLPGVLEFDGPFMSTYAWAGRIVPIDGFPALFPAIQDMLPTLLRQGTYNHRLYTVGQYDSGLALWGNRRLLARAGVRLPERPDEPWTLAQFEDALARLQRSGVAHPLDLKCNYGAGEWFTYAFAPLVQSFGGDLVDRDGGGRAAGFINGPAAVRALDLVQHWVRAGYVDAAARDDAAFISGRAALSWVGHWTYPDYRRALGGDLALIPMPAFGARPVTGAGSWNFGISADCKDPEAAAEVLAYLMSPAQIQAVTAANGAMPGTWSTLRASHAYSPGGPLFVYAVQMARGLARTRPETPAYPVITLAFAEAVNNILAGAGARAELDRAARTIDQDRADNRAYPVP